MRTAFIQELAMLAREHSGLFLIAGDLGYSVVEAFAAEFPERFLNAGVAEQNLTGVAAGLASEGYHAFTYSIANFPTFRCAEQIRNDVAYHNLPVTIVAVGGGLAYGNLGYSHHAVQDYALLRTFPGMLVAAPGDPAETRACLRYLVANPGPSYLRLGKAGEAAVHKQIPNIAPGVMVPVESELSKPAARKLLLSTGAAMKITSDALRSNRTEGWQHFSLPIWSETAKRKAAEQLRQYDVVITIEDHLYAGGFGSYISEALNAAGMRTILRHVALAENVCGLVATQSVLNEHGGLSIATIQQAMEFFG